MKVPGALGGRSLARLEARIRPRGMEDGPRPQPDQSGVRYSPASGGTTTMLRKILGLAALAATTAALTACTGDTQPDNSTPAAPSGQLQQTVFDFDEGFEAFTISTPAGASALMCYPILEGDDADALSSGMCNQVVLSFWELPDGDWEVGFAMEPESWDSFFADKKLIIWHY